MSTLKADTLTTKSDNTNISITGAGTGKVALGDGTLIFPDADGSANQPIITNGSAALSFATLPIAGGGTGSTSTTYCDLTANVTGTMPVANGGTGATSTTYCDLTANVTGTMPVANGGTGATTLTANSALLGNGTSALQAIAPGSSGNVLTSDGSTWASTAASGGGAWTLITSTDVSGDPGPSEIVYTDLDSTAYQNYILAWQGISNSSGAGAITLRISTNNGTSYDTGDNYRWWSTHQSDISTAWNKDFSSGGTDVMRIGWVDGDTDGRAQGWCFFTGTEAGSTPLFSLKWQTGSVGGGNFYTGYGQGSWEDTSAINAIKVYTAVAWDKGRITLYGLSYS